MKQIVASSALMQVEMALLRQVAQRLMAGTARHGSLQNEGISAWADPSAFDQLIQEACKRYSVDPALVKGVIAAESGFNPMAESVAGAKGLMQLTDATASSLGVEDAFDPAQNIDAGVRFLRQLLDRFQDEAMALAAYNAGPGAVEQYGGLPPYHETQLYVPRVLSYRNEFSVPETWEA